MGVSNLLPDGEQKPDSRECHHRIADVDDVYLQGPRLEHVVRKLSRRDEANACQQPYKTPSAAVDAPISWTIIASVITMITDANMLTT